MRTTRDGERASRLAIDTYVTGFREKRDAKQPSVFPAPAVVPAYIVFEADRVDSVKLRQRVATINSRIHPP